VENIFKFTVSYNNKPISTSIFDADFYNQSVRQNVNIKNLIPDIRRNLQKVLSTPTNRLNNNLYVGMDKDNNRVTLNVNDCLEQNLPSKFKHITNPNQSDSVYLTGKDINHEILMYYFELMNSKHTMYIVLKDNTSKPITKDNLLITENSIKDKKENKEYKFTSLKLVEILEEYQFKFSLFLNSNYIVEREFTVYNFNTASTLSKDFIDVISVIVKDIKQHLYKTDRNHIYDDGYLIEYHGLTIPQIRQLTPEERKKLLNSSYYHEEITNDE
jgi:hypothetical protein